MKGVGEILEPVLIEDYDGGPLFMRMSLTKDDLQQIERLISKGFAQGFEHLVIPYVDTKVDELRHELVGRLDGVDSRLDGVDSRLDGVDSRLDRVDSRLDGLDSRLDRLDSRLDGLDSRLDGLKGKMNEHFLSLHEKIDENTALIGYYFEKCVSKEAFAGHEQRIRKLEMSR